MTTAGDTRLPKGELKIRGEYLRALVRHKLSALDALLEDLHRETSIYGPRLFAQALRAVLQAIARSFDQEASDLTARGAADQTIYKLAETYLAVLHEFHAKLMPYVAPTDSSAIPVQILTVLRKLSRVIHPDVSLSLLPDWKYTYQFHGLHNFVASLLRNFTAPAPPGFPEWFVFISYPRLEAKNALLHTLMVHELGHLKDLIDGMSRAILAGIKIDPAPVTALAKEIGQTQIPRAAKRAGAPPSSEEGPARLTLQDLYGDRIQQNVHSRITTILGNWVKEAVADLVAARLLGPAFFFALAELSAAIAVMDKHADSHAASRFRLTYILTELEHLRFVSDISLAPIKEALAGWKGDLQSKEPRPDEPHQEIAYDTLVNSFGLIRNAVQTAPGLYTYRVEIFNRDVETIVGKYLCRGIPPIERWDPATGTKQPFNLVSVINAAWVTYLTRIEDFYAVTGAATAAERVDSLVNFSELILKAIEANDILQSWQE